MKIKSWLLIAFSALLLSCSEEDVEAVLGDPVISLETGEYKVKIGKEIVIGSSVENAVNPIYSWKLDGKIISTEKELKFKGEYIGEYFVTLRVDAANGFAEQQVKVIVVSKMVPEIDMSSAILAYADQDKEIKANVLYTDETTTYVWRLNGAEVSETDTYVYHQTALGAKILTLKVTNEDGADFKVFTITTLPPPAPELFFDNGHYRTVTNKDELRKMTVPRGRNLVLSPVIMNIDEPSGFVWTVNGTTQSASTGFFTFKPSEEGVYTITVTEQSTSARAEVEVTCTKPEGTYFRAITEDSKATAKTVFDYIPAPGQFVNYQTGSTKARAMQDAQRWLDAGNTSSFIHIGAYGGYWIVGFDHSVKNEKDKADLLIRGNAFAGWSEPGIVWVMQDENGNGLPDDTWYELKGSETGKETTYHRYAITYYKPSEAGSDVLWTDNKGQSGSVDYNGYHTQAYYFPMFISEDYYTLTGTRIAPNFFINGGIEYAKDLPWGYVDNYNTDPTRKMNEFWIEDAIQADGSPIDLTCIDFVKVHTGTLGKGAAVGEVSTEGCVPSDLNFN